MQGWLNWACQHWLTGGSEGHDNLVAEGTGPRTRAATGAQNIRVSGARIDIRKYTFSKRVPAGWNSLPDSLTRVGTVLEFKKGYDEWRRRLGA